MKTRAIAFVVIVGMAVALAIGLRSGNRADAAGGNCYAGEQGPTSPTVCS